MLRTKHPTEGNHDMAKKSNGKKKGKKQSSGGMFPIRHSVTINFVSENPAEECEWFGPDANEPFASGPMIDIFLDAKDGLIGIRDEEGAITLGAKESAAVCKTLFVGELAPLGGRGKLASTLNSNATIKGMTVNWDGDAHDLSEDQRDEFLKACERKGAIVVWKQIRAVDWDVKGAEDLEELLDGGDHDSYEDFIAVV